MLDAEAVREQCPENMAGTLPVLNPACCTPDCTEPVSVMVPGPPGDDAVPCTPCEDGENAYTTFTAAFTMPAELGSAVATVGSTAWMAVNQILYAAKVDGSVRGSFQVTAIGGATSVTLKNLEDAATGAYSDNSAAGTVFTIGSQLQPGGNQGPAGLPTSTTIAGQVTGTLAASELTVAATLGALPVGNGSEAAPLLKGTDGQILVSDAAAALDLTYKTLLPNTAGANVADNAILRLDTATGLPIPAQASPMVLTDNGALQVQYGNAKGADAVDLQASHAAVTNVASGARAVIGGGGSNISGGVESVVAGGLANNAAAARSTVSGGGSNNINAAATEATIAGGISNVVGAAGLKAAIAGGQGNIASGLESTVSGGRINTSSGTNSNIAGGLNNAASGTNAAVGGGTVNTASNTSSTVAGGQNNVASGLQSAIGGGDENTASGELSCVPGGKRAKADKYGQMAQAAGYFAVAGDAQRSRLVWRRLTTAAVVNVPMFLDGAAALATIPANMTWAFHILVVARDTAGPSAAWEIKGAIRNNAGVVALVSAVTTTLIADNTGGTWGVVGNVVVEADNVNDALNIRVAATVNPAADVRWVATSLLAEAGWL